MNVDAPPIFGLDIGAATTVCAKDDGELLRNELGGHTTATLVAYLDDQRCLGEAAVPSLSSKPKNTVTHVGRYACLPPDASAALAPHRQFSLADDGGSVELADGRRVPVTAALGALLGKVRATSSAPAGAEVALAVPPCTSPEMDAAAAEAALARARAALVDAAAVGGWAAVALPTSIEAAAAALARKWPAAPTPADGEAAPPPPRVLIIDVGAASAAAAVVSLDGSAVGYELIASAADCATGCASFDAAVWTELAAKQVKAKAGVDVVPGTKAGARLLGACERLRKLCSTLPSATTTAENIGDIDVGLALTRDELGALGAPALARLRALVDGVLGGAGDAPITGVELFGGGCRMPAVQQVVTDALEAAACAEGVRGKPFGAKLDDASVAIGAAALGKLAKEEAAAAPTGALDAAALAALVAEEAALAEGDAAAAADSATRNAYEGFVLEARGWRADRKHGSLIDGSKLEPLLDAAEEWLYSEEGEATKGAALEAKLASLREEVDGVCGGFREARAAAKAADEAALEAASAAAKAEREANGDDDDHDQRKLKFPERMKLALSNKKEGTELFQGGNYKHAAARYNKALTHACKFFDVSPQQQAEVDATKLGLHLNIAQCWLKIQEGAWVEQVVRSCKDALAIDADCVKALYRRATALESKGDYELAKADLTRAAELAPDDKAVAKLGARVDAQIKRQEQKEKKMYSKMFA